MRAYMLLGSLIAMQVCTPSLLRAAGGHSIVMPVEELADRTRGGLLGQLLGNLNGLKHELEYIDEPGHLTDYTPALSEGAWTDDDTDFEWVYIYEMQRRNKRLLSHDEITELWKTRINKRIWCSNLYARQLMELGITPPLTGNRLLNPWAGFNLSGQFLSETFGLTAPAMPQTAAGTALHYTTVAISGEPAQATQYFASMIALAFVEHDIATLVSESLEATDSSSDIRSIVSKVSDWHRQYPDDWRKTRRLIRDTYTRNEGGLRDSNGYELNTAATFAALLYGEGNLRRTLELAFNMGWDCDNNAAMAGTVVGIITGYRQMLSEGWTIVDRYRNTTRQHMPLDETITSFADRIIELSERHITSNGGSREFGNGSATVHIPAEAPRCLQSLVSYDGEIGQLADELGTQVTDWVVGGETAAQRAKGVYLAVCLDMEGHLQRSHPAEWHRGLQDLRSYDKVAQVLYFHSDIPSAERLKTKFRQVGLTPPQ